jgi:tungstate transport system substrate-binding protein
VVARKPLKLCALTFLLVASACGGQKKTRLVLAATTSLEDTGLLDILAAEFAKTHPDIELSPVAVGTGQAIQLGRRGDADVLLSHDSAAEMELVSEGVAVERSSVMYNDFIIVGASSDPASAKGSDPRRGLTAIAKTGSTFVSRGDDSGTHRKEKALWRAAGVEPDSIEGSWYIRAGVGMGDALLLAGEKHAYVLTDRGTYLRFKPRIGLAVLVEGDSALHNKYGVTVMKGERQKAAEVFARWVRSEQVQRIIGNFGRAEFGQPLFTPSARP